MHVTRLEARGFRNLAPLTLEPHRRLNVFLGDNGQGKTNLLESVHLVTALRPLRTIARGSDLICAGASQAHVAARLDLDGPLDVDVALEPQGRRARIAGKVVKDVGEIARRVRVVAFTPEDLTIVRGAPVERRRAIDRFAFSLDASFSTIARRYEAALERRNRLLRAHARDHAQIDAYTTTLVDAGVLLTRKRAEAVRTWAPLFREAAHAVSEGALDAAVRYRPDVEGTVQPDGAPVDDDTARARLTEALEAAREGELRRRATLVGPHKDDLEVALFARGARHMASQGEARALVLALKIASVRALTAAHGTAPLLLLDDVAGELDRTRARLLFALIDEVETQAFVTATHDALLPGCGAHRAFEIVRGTITMVHDRDGVE